MPQTLELDVRHYHSEGREPFGDIMEMADRLKSGDLLVLRNTFEPVPLYAVMGSRGFAHETDRQADDDWFVTFRKL